MNVTILHYHLNRGGVTQVILNHLRALNQASGARDVLRVAVLCGGRRAGWPEAISAELDAVQLTLCEIPELDYDEDRPVAPAALAQRIRSTMARLDFAPQDTVFHAHNHALGKNVSLPGAISELARDGYRWLLQIHDFAEDFRPQNYRRLVRYLASASPNPVVGQQYPQAAQIHYAVLNARDYRTLVAAGMDGNCLHLLPNPVEAPLLAPALQARTAWEKRYGIARDQLLLLYPVRCIRRKNVGESLLWSVLSRGRATVAISLAPINPLEKPAYERWRTLADQIGLACRFDVGEPGGLTFAENLAASDSILTTSVSEGFGMVFLESWLTGRPLVGRDLPEITIDFVKAGVEFPQLMLQLRVPLQWIDVSAFREMIAAEFRQVLESYGEPAPEQHALDRVTEQWCQDNTIDFALLGSDLQSQVICKAHQSQAHCQQLLDVNPAVDEALAWDRSHASGTIEHNARIIRDQYSFRAFGERLFALYAEIVRSPLDTSLQPLAGSAAILHQYLDPSRLHLIRVEP